MGQEESGQLKVHHGNKLINMFDLNPFKNHIGLDISDYKIRFIQFSKKNKQKVIISAFGEIPVMPGQIVDGNIKDELAVTNLITKMIDNPTYGKIEKKYVNSALPEKQTFIKVIEIPEVPQNELKGTVGWGIEQNIPVKLENVFFDWKIINSFQENGVKKYRVIVSVAPKKLVEIYTKIIKNSDLIPINLETESTAISRSLINKDIKHETSMLLIDLGRSRTNFIIFSHDTVQYSSSLDVSGHEMTKEISEKMKLSYNDAEKAKVIYGLDPKKARGTVRKILIPVIDRLIININEHINYFNTYVASKSQIKTILLTGSVSQTHGLTEYLRSNLKLSISIGDPFENLKIIESKKINWKNYKYSFTTSVGLALKEFE